MDRMSSFAHPDMIVDTEWSEHHLADPLVRFVEVDVDTASYAEANLPGAIAWDWSNELCDVRVRDIIPKAELVALLQRSGIRNDTTVVLYGDNNNWFACWALWQLKIYGHADVRLMDGGRNKWIAEGRPLSTDPVIVTPSQYEARDADFTTRAYLKDVMSVSERGAASLIDVRSPAEFSGEILAPPGLPETCQRGGHIPTATSVPWHLACREDGTFKAPGELLELYRSHGVTPDRPAIAYCRIGERSSHTWFVLKYLLGFPDVRNYDGSWTEWGNLVGAPIER
jgi:thiosulfate/3-mercaptopyruvate sulfurtransferase